MEICTCKALIIGPIEIKHTGLGAIRLIRVIVNSVLDTFQVYSKMCKF